MAVTSKTQNLSRDLVAKAFADYGYKPKSSTELDWWSQQPSSAYTKLINNLQKRRDDDKEKFAKSLQEKKSSNQPMAGFPSVEGTSGSVASSIGGKTKIYPLGDSSLVKFDDYSTVFRIDWKNKELRPYMSEQAFNTAFAGREKQAWGAIHRLDSREYLDPNGAFKDFTILDSKYGIGNNGKPLKEPEFRRSNVDKRYGEPVLPKEKIQEMSKNLSDVLFAFSKDKRFGLSSSFISEAMKDPNLMSYYVGAMAYGDFSLSDIYKDLKKRELQAMGIDNYDNMQFLSDTLKKDQFINTPEGRASSTDTRITIPTEVIADNPDLWNDQANKIPQESFRALDKDLTKPLSEKNKAEAAKIQSAMHDVLLAKLNANTDTEEAYADWQYKNLKEDIEKQYGIRLSNNARQAWNQIEQLFSGTTEAGLTGTGIEAEQIDDYLKEVRRQGSELREEKLTEEERKQAEYVRNFASSSDMKKLDDEDKAKGLPESEWRTVKWGLKPKKELLDAISFEALKKRYPDYTDDQIKRLREQVVDENGNLRSNLYEKQYQKMYNYLYGPTEEQKWQQSGESKEEYQERMQREKMEREAKKQKQEFQTQDPNSWSTNLPPEPKKEGDLGKKEEKPKEYEVYPGVSPVPKGTSLEEAQAMEIEKQLGLKDKTPPVQQQTQQQQIQQKPKKATLYGPSGAAPIVVDVGSSQASQLQSQGWGLTPGSYKAPVQQQTQQQIKPQQTFPNIQKNVQNVTSQKQPQQQSYKPLPVLPQQQQKQQTPWQMPLGYEKISGALYNTGAKQKAAYSDIQKDPTNTYLYGKKK